MKATDLTIARADLGWLVTCRVCGWEAFAERRPAADRVAFEHRKTHGEGRK